MTVALFLKNAANVSAVSEIEIDTGTNELFIPSLNTKENEEPKNPFSLLRGYHMPT